MKDILHNLYNHESLSKATAKEVLMKMAAGQYNPSQIASFMSVYLMRPITLQELSGFQEAMMELCLRIEFDTDETIDIVGTGGDGKDTFNISTLSCFVVAASGIKVVKHGNYGVSSVSGSSNVLEAIGYKFTNDQNQLQKEVAEAGLCFLHAPLFHPAMKNVSPIRIELGVRTFFNLLGPIVNPASPKYQLLGVYSQEMARLYHYLLQNTDVEYRIVHSLDGYDEISLTGPYKVISRHDEEVTEPESRLNQEDLFGGTTAAEAAQLFLRILHGEGTEAQNRVVAANAGMAIHCVKNEISLDDCCQWASDILHSKQALMKYNKLIEL